MEEGYTVLELNVIKHVACFFSILRLQRPLYLLTKAADKQGEPLEEI